MGRPPRASAEEVCREIATHHEPVITAADVHEALEMTQRGAQERLKRLEEDGYLTSKKVGAAGRVYWMTDKGIRTLQED